MTNYSTYFSMTNLQQSQSTTQNNFRHRPKIRTTTPRMSQMHPLETQESWKAMSLIKLKLKIHNHNKGYDPNGQIQYIIQQSCENNPTEENKEQNTNTQKSCETK